jgi:hypothetical protein
MAAVLEDMLLLSHLGQEGALDVREADLAALADDAVQEARATAPNCKINYAMSTPVTVPGPAADAEPGDALVVEGDQARLRQVIRLMIKNALSRAPDGTGIEVRVGGVSSRNLRRELAAAETEPDTWPGPLTGTIPEEAADTAAAAVLEITDCGRQLSDEQLRHAFEGFAVVGPASATGGSGLDLAVVAAVVTAHGGAAWAKPQQFGKGITYCLAIPLASYMRSAQPDDADANAAAELAEAGAADFQGAGGMSVSQLAAVAYSGAEPVAVTGPDSAETRPAPVWLEAGPVDEISFLAVRGPRHEYWSRPQRRPGRPEGGVPVGRAEQAHVHEQRMQLVQRNTGSPAVRQGCDLLVAGHHPVQVGRAEQGEHGQVGFPVTAVSSRVDEPAPVT